jgi:molybdopterin converting factor small subunit
MEHQAVHIRLFGSLHTLRRERGLATTVTLDVPEEGITAREIALFLRLPLEEIEGVFVNHIVHDIDHVVRSGDRIAFVPPGTPGPHRVFLGLRKAGGRSA